MRASETTTFACARATDGSFNAPGVSSALEFQATGGSLALCDQIVDRMMELFGISVDEALGRVNGHWRGFQFEDLDMICHETADFWANNIYFGNHSFWWLKPAGLTPLPYP